MKARIGIETIEIEFLRWIDDYSHTEQLTFNYESGTYKADFYKAVLNERRRVIVARALCNPITGKISLISLISP